MKKKTKKTPATDDIQKVVATGKEAREGSFFYTVSKLATKPIMLETLIGQVIREVGKTLRSEKDPAVVCRVRTVAGLKTLGFLKATK